MFRRILIANRGEIAMRILRCCQEMGIETVAAYSEEDADTLPVQFATESVCIGPAPAAKSYLDQNVLLAAAKAYHCEAIHPGYGFLSENADFAGQCEKNGIVNIKGHRTVGGMRASIYNAMPYEGVVKLIEVMKQFEKEHA